MEEKKNGNIYAVIMLTVLLAIAIIVIVLMSLGIITINLKKEQKVDNNTTLVSSTENIITNTKNSKYKTKGEFVKLITEEIVVNGKNVTIDEYYSYDTINGKDDVVNVELYIEFVVNNNKIKELQYSVKNIDENFTNTTGLVDLYMQKQPYFSVITDTKKSEDYIVFSELTSIKNNIEIYKDNFELFKNIENISCFEADAPYVDDNKTNFYIKDNFIYYIDNTDLSDYNKTEAFVKNAWVEDGELYITINRKIKGSTCPFE